jgi:hypothetical protein
MANSLTTSSKITGSKSMSHKRSTTKTKLYPHGSKKKSVVQQSVRVPDADMLSVETQKHQDRKIGKPKAKRR